MTTALEVATLVLERVRDPEGVATTINQVYDLIDRVQVLLVRGLGLMARDRTFSSEPDQTLYPVDPDETLQILDLFQGAVNRRLSPCRWAQMIQVRRDWWRYSILDGEVPETMQVWAPVGTSLLVMWPPSDTFAEIVTVREQQRPAMVTEASSVLDLPDEHLPLLQDIVEVLLLLRTKHVEAAEIAMGRLEPQKEE